MAATPGHPDPTPADRSKALVAALREAVVTTPGKRPSTERVEAVMRVFAQRRRYSPANQRGTCWSARKLLPMRLITTYVRSATTKRAPTRGPFGHEAGARSDSQAVRIDPYTSG